MTRKLRSIFASGLLLAGVAIATPSLAEQPSAPAQPQMDQMVDKCMRMMETSGAPKEPDKDTSPHRHH